MLTFELYLQRLKTIVNGTLHPSKYNTFVATTLWYILTSVWVLPTPNAGQNQLFHVFAHLSKILMQKL